MRHQMLYLPCETNRDATGVLRGAGGGLDRAIQDLYVRRAPLDHMHDEQSVLDAVATAELTDCKDFFVYVPAGSEQEAAFRRLKATIEQKYPSLKVTILTGAKSHFVDIEKLKGDIQRGNPGKSVSVKVRSRSIHFSETDEGVRVEKDGDGNFTIWVTHRGAGGPALAVAGNIERVANVESVPTSMIRILRNDVRVALFHAMYIKDLEKLHRQTGATVGEARVHLGSHTRRGCEFIAFIGRKFDREFTKLFSTPEAARETLRGIGQDPEFSKYFTADTQTAVYAIDVAERGRAFNVGTEEDRVNLRRLINTEPAASSYLGFLHAQDVINGVPLMERGRINRLWPQQQDALEAAIRTAEDVNESNVEDKLRKIRRDLSVPMTVTGHDGRAITVPTFSIEEREFIIREGHIDPPGVGTSLPELRLATRARGDGVFDITVQPLYVRVLFPGGLDGLTTTEVIDVAGKLGLNVSRLGELNAKPRTQGAIDTALRRK